MVHAPAPSPAAIRIRRDIRPHAARFCLAMALVLAASCAGLAVPLMVREVLGRFAADRPVASAVTWLLVVAVFASVVGGLGRFLATQTGELVVFAARRRLTDHALRMPLASVQKEGTGTIAARITYDVSRLRHIVDVWSQAPISVLTLLATLAAMLWIDWFLALLTAVTLAGGLGLSAVVLGRVRSNYSDQHAAIGTLSHRITVSLNALTAIKSFRAEDFVSRSLDDDAEEIRGLSLTGARLEAGIPAASSIANQLSMVAVLLIGGLRLVSGDLDLSSFGAFLLYFFMAVGPAGSLASGFSRLQEGRAAQERCNTLFALPLERDDDVVEPPVAPALPPPSSSALASAVEFAGVSFTYPDADTEALHHVSFAVARTGLTAIVGPSGAGKTTVLSLIDRLINPHAGRVTVLGHDVGQWPLAALRTRIAYVDQAFTLLEATVRENLTLGRTTLVTDAELTAALGRVGLAEDIARLPDGLDTRLGRESNLSGGQRQRLALARVLLSDADIVVLDEPTSQLDGINEERLRAVVDELAASRAVIVVAHRLSTVRHAEHVIMMEAGGVVDAGDHRTLLDHCAPYREMVAAQDGVTTAGSAEPVSVDG